MNWDFEEIKKTATLEAEQLQDDRALEDFRIKYLGKKGLIAEMYAALAQLPSDQKPVVGKEANSLKTWLAQILDEKKSKIDQNTKSDTCFDVDVTLPGAAVKAGHRHLLSQTVDEICSLFEKLGFVIQDGPEIESETNNFDGLNIPPDHPSRDGFDTFYLDAKDPADKKLNLLLRSHTSPGQVRIMREHKPPLAVVIPGRVYRPDAVDASHSFMFHQIEGLLVDKNVTFSDLKGLLEAFCRKFFGKDIKMRFRPHFFPFTEPSAEVDISWEKGKKDWLEIMGCGMVHPRVFEFAGYPKGKYTGLAFGLGVERIAMLRHGITDIRTFYENDLRFLEQF